jgi:hypothetical protein
MAEHVMVNTIPGADPGGEGRTPSKIGNNMIFWRKIVIFHTEYPKNFRTSLRNWKKNPRNQCDTLKKNRIVGFQFQFL